MYEKDSGNLKQYRRVLLIFFGPHGCDHCAQVFFPFALTALVFYRRGWRASVLYDYVIGASMCDSPSSQRVDTFVNLCNLLAEDFIGRLDCFASGFALSFPIAWRFNISSRIPSTALQVPLSVVYTPVVIAIILTSLRLCVNIYKTITAKPFVVEVKK